jgi:hypothetical protein
MKYRSNVSICPSDRHRYFDREWSVSRSFVPRDAVAPYLPEAEVVGEFTRLEAEADGLIQLNRYVRVPEKSNVPSPESWAS